MKEVDKKDTPEVSGGHYGPFCTDQPVSPIPDYPQGPIVPLDEEFTDPSNI